jgi:hypothetical protein
MPEGMVYVQNVGCNQEEFISAYREYHPQAMPGY